MNWTRVKISFSLIRSALVCLTGSISIRRKPCNIIDIDIDIQTAEGGIRRQGVRTPICRVSKSVCFILSFFSFWGTNQKWVGFLNGQMLSVLFFLAL